MKHLGEGCNFMELTDPWTMRHIYSPFKHSDRLLALHDRDFLNYPSCTMKYVVRAT